MFFGASKPGTTKAKKFQRSEQLVMTQESWERAGAIMRTK
jgi:hypothetical protein